VSIKNVVKASIPNSFLPVAKRLYYSTFRATVRPWYALVEMREKLDPVLKHRIQKSMKFPLPPPLLRFRIAEDTNPYAFLSVGKTLTNHLQVCLKTINASLSDFRDVLDFGCGCGRILIHVMSDFPGHRYTGIDVDSEAIAWCRNNLSSASFKVNRPKPPLDFADASFDLIYGISVFTHIDRASQ
jgi:SAM-dependent methyltransferase